MNEEKKILEQFGKDNHFTVPEGYFDTLTSRIMSNIPAEETKVVSIDRRHKTGWLRWTGLAAACMAGAIIGFNMLERTNSTDKQPYANNTQTTYGYSTYSNEYQEEMLDYAMVDYNDVYNYLSGDEY